MDTGLRLISGGGGSGLLHWIAELDSADPDAPSYKLSELVFNNLDNLTPQQVAEIIWKEDHSGARPIHWAAQSGSLHLLKKLLNDDVKMLVHHLPVAKVEEVGDSMDTDSISTVVDPVNCLDDKNETPLFYAALTGRYEVGGDNVYVFGWFN